MLTKLYSLRNSQEDGFTLIELLIVVIIIGILASIAIPIFLNQQKAAMKASVKSDLRNLQIAVATYLVNNPQATNLEWRYNAGGASVTGALASDAKWNAMAPKTSDPNTLLIVRKGFASSGASGGPGDWTGYSILAANSTLSESGAAGSYYYYRWASDTGQYSEVLG